MYLLIFVQEIHHVTFKPPITFVCHGFEHRRPTNHKLEPTYHAFSSRTTSIFQKAVSIAK